MQPEFSKKYINAYLCLGSNTGKVRQNLIQAIAFIEKKIGKVNKKSHLYETQPWGNPDQDSFLNQIIMVNTTLDPRQMLEEITRIEREMGRERKEKWGPRIIDIDIVLYGKRVIRDKGLEIPHPEMHKRAFVLVPLMELDPDYIHPVLQMPIDELYMSCQDESDVRRLDE
jgi:2-amino-4-hydroxy-6-hydroxymethyldihydropteridine diphosphokinase